MQSWIKKATVRIFSLHKIKDNKYMNKLLEAIAVKADIYLILNCYSLSFNE